MAKADSSKKIARVQRAGVSKHPGQRRALAFPLAIGAIIVFGSLLVFLARDARVNFTGAQPRTGGVDAWTSAFNIYDCDSYTNPKWSDASDSKDLGIGTRADGLIHISPTSEEAAGDKARFGLWADRVGLKVTSNSFTTPDKVTRKNGDDCKVKGKSKKGEVKLFVWPPQANKNVDPDVLTGSDITDRRFTGSGEIFVLAFVQQGTDEIPFPDSAVAALKDTFAGSNTATTVATTTAAPTTAAPTTAAPTTTAKR